jgi:hypothetical protein
MSATDFLAQEAARSPAQPFASLTDAIAYWRGRDRAPLRRAIAPPPGCGRTGDQAFDAALATMFRAIVDDDAMITRVGRIAVAINFNDRAVRALKTYRAPYAEDAAEAIARFEQFSAILRDWTARLIDGGPHANR